MRIVHILYAPRQCLGVRAQRLVDLCGYRMGKDLFTTINSQMCEQRRRRYDDHYEDEERRVILLCVVP